MGYCLLNWGLELTMQTSTLTLTAKNIGNESDCQEEPDQQSELALSIDLGAHP